MEKHILVLSPITGLPPGEIAYRRELLQSLPGPGTRVSFEVVAEGPLSIESRWEEDWGAVAAFGRARGLSRDDCDAVIVCAPPTPESGR